MSIRIRISSFLGKQERQRMLQDAALSFVQCQLIDDWITIKGCQEQVDKVRGKRKAPCNCSPFVGMV